MSVDLEKLMAEAPDNFVIQNALIQCVDIVENHKNISCSVSGGG